MQSIPNHTGKTLKAKSKEQNLEIDPIRYETLHLQTGWNGCRCKAASRPAIILDPFMGSVTTALVAQKLGRDFIGFEPNPKYVKIAKRRIKIPTEHSIQLIDSICSSTAPFPSQLLFIKNGDA